MKRGFPDTRAKSYEMSTDGIPDLVVPRLTEQRMIELDGGTSPLARQPAATQGLHGLVDLPVAQSGDLGGDIGAEMPSLGVPTKAPGALVASLRSITQNNRVPTVRPKSWIGGDEDGSLGGCAQALGETGGRP